MLKGNTIYLRALEPTDIMPLYVWENDPENWKVSGTLVPYSKSILEEYLLHAHKDLYTTRQFRFMICILETSKPIGTIDLFEFDPFNQRAGIGILIGNKDARRKGHASDALNVLCDYSQTQLNLKQLFCNINTNNLPSIGLFEKNGFEKAGTKKSWIKNQNQFEDEYFYQKVF